MKFHEFKLTNRIKACLRLEHVIALKNRFPPNPFLRIKPAHILPQVSHLKIRLGPFVIKYKTVIIVSIVASFSLSYLGIIAIKARNDFIAGMKSAEEYPSAPTASTPNEASDSSDTIYKLLSLSDESVLGASSKKTEDREDPSDDYVYPASKPIIFPTDIPLPTMPPMPTYVPYTPYTYPSATPQPDCGGTPTAYNSEAIVSASVSTVNNPVSIEIQLLDCHNNFAPANDDLKISLKSSDGTARINGTNSPVYLKAQNGKATVTVNSQTNTTDTFEITDTTRQFNITDPHNRNPSVTFSNNSSGNSNCTTAAGVANFWYSNVYPASPQTSVVGNPFSFNVQIKDCNKNIVPSDESLNITLVGGDSSATVNGHGLPYSITAHSGQINLSVNSNKPGTVTIAIYDSSHSFGITDQNNRNPSVNFTGQAALSSTPAPSSSQPTATSAPAQNPTRTPSPTPASSPTTQPQPTATIPVPTVTPH